VLISSAGLAVLTYGLIKAGQNGWTDATVLTTMSVGVAALIAFVGWERYLGRRQDGGAGRSIQPLVDLSLFRSAGFTWGTVLSTLVSFALFGIVFAMPQYFLDVRGLNSLGAGIRLLPMIGGLVVGLVAGQRLLTPRKARVGDAGQTDAALTDAARAEVAGADAAPADAARADAARGGAGRVSAKVVATAGFAIMAVSLAVGAGTAITSGTSFAAAWFAMTGLGLGLAMPTALNAALGALSPERSGSGSALITAMRQVGGTIGVAVLGTVLASVYRSHLHLTSLPAAATTVAHSGVAGGIAVARAAASGPLLDLVRIAYVHGLDVMLWACGGIAAAAALMALAFLPRQAADLDPAEPADRPTGQSPTAAGVADPDAADLQPADLDPTGAESAGGGSAVLARPLPPGA
jgi:DHA2 family multidrug resistance protein-like MFS transporter